MNSDVLNLDYETCLRSYGKIPMGGMLYDSVVNIKKVDYMRSSLIDQLSGLYSLSISLGLIRYLEEDESFCDAIRRVDEAMYKAKKVGRGKIVVANSKSELYIIEGGEDEQGQSSYRRIRV